MHSLYPSLWRMSAACPCRIACRYSTFSQTAQPFWLATTSHFRRHHIHRASLRRLHVSIGLYLELWKDDCGSRRVASTLSCIHSTSTRTVS
jgi:hypothetical protein